VFHYPDPATGSWTSPLVQDDALPIDNTPPFTRQLQHFARVCRGEEEPGCSALEALKAIATLEAIKESITTGLPVVVPQE
jgi:predicted dehydrogenase